MLPDYGRYYGSVFTLVIEQFSQPIVIRKLEGGFQGFYLLGDKVPLYVKFSRSRKGPWSFNFHHDHQVRYMNLVGQYGDCITALVCGKDGIVGLNHSQTREVLDDEFNQQEVITVRRKLKQMYSVVGSNGKLSGKLARDSLLDVLEQALGLSARRPKNLEEGDDPLIDLENG